MDRNGFSAKSEAKPAWIPDLSREARLNSGWSDRPLDVSGAGSTTLNAGEFGTEVMMASSVASLLLLLSVTSTGGLFDHRPGGKILQNGPGNGWGFPNGNPDGYGYFDTADALPLGANRTAEYHFPRYLAVPPEQLFFPTYYNPYTTRGQRFLPYAGCGGCHPAGGHPTDPGTTPLHPYNDTLSDTPKRPLPAFSGRVEAPPINPGQSGLRP